MIYAFIHPSNPVHTGISSIIINDMEELTVTEFVDRYLREAKTFYKSFSALSSVHKTFANLYGDRLLVTLAPPDLHDFVHHRLKAGRKPSTINQELALLRSSINYVRYHWGVLMANPVVRQRLKSTALRLRYLTKSEASALLAAASNPQLAEFIRLALHTGCRKNELLTLRWSDVDQKYNTIQLKPENTKSNKARAIPLNKTARNALQALKQGNQTEWVFHNNKGGRKKTFRWFFCKAIQSAGIEDFHIHDLRHTFASWLVSEGVELIKVRDLLGHTTIRMTERYAHLMPGRLLEAVEVLDTYSSSDS